MAVKAAEVVPAGTVTIAGTATAALLLERFAISPPAGAALFSLTVHALLELPVTDELLQTSDDNAVAADELDPDKPIVMDHPADEFVEIFS